MRITVYKNLYVFTIDSDNGGPSMEALVVLTLVTYVSWPMLRSSTEVNVGESKWFITN